MRTIELSNNYKALIKIIKDNIKAIGNDVNKYLEDLLNGCSYWECVEDSTLTQEKEERELEAIIDEEIRNNLLYDITVQLNNIVGFGSEWLDDNLTNVYRKNLHKCYDKIALTIANRE